MVPFGGAMRVTRFARNARGLAFEPESLRDWCPRPEGLRSAFGLRSLMLAVDANPICPN